MKLFDLHGKTALVTGGGSGLGRGMALALAEAGAEIVIADINGEKAAMVSREIESLGRNSLSITVDVSKKTMVQKMVEQTVDKFGKLDIAVNCAGIPGTRLSSSENIKEDEARRLIDIMLMGVFFCAQEEGKQMIKQKGGRIINISSISGVIVNKGMIGIAPYCAIKAGVIHMSKALAVEWANYNIKVNAISPGYMKTPATEDVLAKTEKYNEYISQIPMNRFGLPKDLATTVVYLASDYSDYVTGQNIIVDGGVTLW